MTTKSSVQNSLPIKELFLRRNNSEFIHDLVAPTIFSDKVIGHFYGLGDENLIPETDEISGRSGAGEVFHTYGRDTFEIKMHGLKEFIDYSVVDVSDFATREQLRRDTLFIIKDKLLLQKERALANILFNSANFAGVTTALAGVNRWDNAGSDPAAQIILARQTIRQNSGKTPNTLILGAEVNDALAYNVAMGNRISVTDHRILSKQILGDLLKQSGLDIPPERILVGDAQFKTTAGGTSSYVWGKSALFCYIDPNTTTLFNDTLVKQFRLRKNKGVDVGFYKEPDPTINGEWGYGQIDYGFKLVDFNCGYLFTTVVS